MELIQKANTDLKNFKYKGITYGWKIVANPCMAPWIKSEKSPQGG